MTTAALRGRTSYHAGAAAETSVALAYARRGHPTVSTRWRGRGGEIDLIVRDGDGFIFVEVKKSRNHDRAAQSLSRRQMERIMTSASEFVATQPKGLLTRMRFDAALVDATGRIKVIENAFGL